MGGMARQIPPINGAYLNGGAPPPSTLAAQIVRNQTRPAAPQQNGENPTFAQLLYEILNNPSAAQENDLRTNVSLISVVAEAGLAPLARDDPFARQDALILQANDSIAVIEKTIRRQPEVLLTPVSTDGPQLALPLLAQLVSTCGRPRCQNLLVGRLIDNAIRALTMSADFWRHAGTVQQVCQDIVDESIFALEASANRGTSFSVKLPSARSVAKLWPQSENAIALPYDCQASISSPAQAFMLALLLSDIPSLALPWRSETAIRLQRLASCQRKRLEATRQWDQALETMLSRQGNILLLRNLLQESIKVKPPHELQRQLANSLIWALRPIESTAKDLLLPVLQSLAADEVFGELHEDLKIAVTTWLCRFVKGEDLPGRILSLQDALCQDNVMTDGEFQAAFRQLNIPKSNSQCRGRHRKRRKTSEQDSDSPQHGLIQRLTNLLTQDEKVDQVADAEAWPGVYRTLPEDEQYQVWCLLADIAPSHVDMVQQTVSKLLKLQEVRDSRRLRIQAMFAVQACVRQTTDPAVLELRTSEFGVFCLSSLQSSVRELRIVAGKCLPLFLRDDLPSDLKSTNRHIALEYLRQVSDREIAGQHETLIEAWGQIALACGESELNLALLRLVDFLGNPNSLVCAVAFDEIQKLAGAKQQTAQELLRPFWSTVAVSVVQDLNSRPQKAQHLCDLLRMDMNTFLVLTQQYTVPHLILMKKRGILQRIAVARGKGETTHDVCLRPITNLAAALALLLNQSASDPEEAALQCLSEVAPSFRGIDVASLVKLDAVLTACEMLKHCGDEPDDRKARSYHAIQIFASLAQRRSSQPRPHSKPSRIVVEFFDIHILGIMTHFSHVLEDTQGISQMSEKLRCLRGISDMIHLTKSHASIALPQIKAFLQSAMNRPELCETAFSTWLALLSVLDADDVARMLDQTFALIIQYWPQLPPSTQFAIHAKLADLVRSHNKVFQENIMTLPSLKGIPLMSKLASEVERLRALETVESHFRGFGRRLQDESETVARQALRELVPFLAENQEFIHDSAVIEQPVPVLSAFMRTLLDVTTKLSSRDNEFANLCGEALGIIGCLDPNRIDVPRMQRQLLVLSNFERANEVIDWVIAMLEEVLVKAFKSTTNARAQGFLAWVLQELLRFCDLSDSTPSKTRSSQSPSVEQRWMSMPEHVRITLTPFLSSRYRITNSSLTPPNRVYPAFDLGSGHSSWLRSFVFDLMFKAKGDNPQMVFPVLARAIRGHDLAIATFLLPYAVTNVVLGGTVGEVRDISQELLTVLQCRPTNPAEIETAKQCSETVFDVLDYMSNWLQEKKRLLSQIRAEAFRTGHSPGDFDEAKDMAQIKEIEQFLGGIPAEVLAKRAMECGSYARALFNWEQYIRQERALIPSSRMSQTEEEMYSRLHSIYAAIDEPDGLEGIGAHLSFLSEEQQAVQHTKAGRWTAAQAWYELQIAREPSDAETQAGFLNCLRETGQYAPLLRHAQGFLQDRAGGSEPDTETRRILSLALEAHWMTGDMAGLRHCLDLNKPDNPAEYHSGLSEALIAALDQEHTSLASHLSSLRISIAQAMTEARTSSLHACHDELIRLHALHELNVMNGGNESGVAKFREHADKRLAALGSYNADKQYVLGLRRAAMRAGSERFSKAEFATSWLVTARLARKMGNTKSAYNAVLQAFAYGDRSAKLEEARLLWHDGHQRQAIQALQSAIDAGVFETTEVETEENSESFERNTKQSMLSARAHLLLAKWLDASGQSQANDMTTRYQYAAKNFQRWEKGHYYLGKHYNKLLEAEKALPKHKQTTAYLTGETTKLVVENLVRSIPWGNKYWHQTIPKALTLWLDLGMDTLAKAPKEELAVFERRTRNLHLMQKQLQKYSERIPPYVFYSALSQMISRISHPHPDVWKQLSNMITRIVSAHPSEALWSLFPVLRATDRIRADRGIEILNRLKDPRSKLKNDMADLRGLIVQGQRLSEALLHACEEHVEQRRAHVSLSKDLKFNHKLAPSALVVPVEASLTATLPLDADLDKIRRHKGFTQDKITIHSFSDDVRVLSSLQRPRKITARGSDGKQYGLLCKPKDDLRKDRRLMEFNGIINRALKRDAESSKRGLYIKTYAVTPLSEESGTLEWVEGIKPIRDTLLSIYARKGIRPNYQDIRKILEEAIKGPEHAHLHLFKDNVLSQFPPALHEWFTETHSQPQTWFAARLRYTRSAAVMSMTGHILGLGDRHGENILLEESTGGVFHVDFNCLFDKGLTFEKPELVPFRLTHNMVDAMGAYGYEGPFRKSCELTLGLLRQNKDTLMTVLETFLYDPTTDFIGKKKRSTAGVPETPQEILDSVDAKLKGLLRGENVPLGVEGYVDALIREAVSHANLAAMYIGWCPFL